MFSWGENTRSGFGLTKPNAPDRTRDRTNTGSRVDISHTRVDISHTEAPVAHLCAGKEVVAFIRSDGKVSVARMQESQDGKRNTGRLKSLDTKVKIHSLSCGDDHVVLLTVEGRVLYLNNTSNVPRPMDIFQNRQVTQVACGDQHSIALTQDGQLFTWGQNGSGQLGLGLGKPSTLSSPQPLKSLAGIPLAQISAGGDHSFALSLSGAVFGWGRNSAGQLGLGDTADRHTPAPVDFLNLKRTVFISCGEEHTAVLTKGGVLFTFGSGRHGQLGHNSLRDEVRPRVVAELWGSKVTQVACGRHHTLVLGGSSNKIYSFGRGEQGQLGNGVKMDQSVPLPVQLSNDNTDDQQIQRIFAGGHHSFALCSSVQATERLSHNLSSSHTSIQTLDEAVIEHWISECDSKSWRKIQNEISKIFSSASCLNGSFLDTSCDQHYQTSKAYSGLDLSLARLAFQKLATKDKVLTKVEEVVRCDLLPSLSKEPVGVEELRVYLVLPELLRVLLKQGRHASDLAVAVAVAILSLHADKLKLLEGLWSRLPGSFFRAVVKSLRSVSGRFMDQTPKNLAGHTQLNTTLRVLQRLYEVNNNRLERIRRSNFHLSNRVKSLFQSIEQLEFDLECLEEQSLYWWFMDQEDYLEKENILVTSLTYFKKSLSFLRKYPCILDEDAKCSQWALALEEVQTSIHEVFESFSRIYENKITVDRQTALCDTFHFLRENACYFEVPVQVKFKEEDGDDQGGVSLMFFTLLAKELLKPEHKILDVNEHSGLAWFTSEDWNLTDEFYLLGLICGMALYNRCLLNLCFPVALFKKLLGQTPTLEDLKELSPVEARGLQQLLNEDEEVLEALNLDFTFKGQELIPNGGDVLVTKVNRQKYVDLYVDMVFNKSVGRQFEEFRNGFLEACPLKVWKMFLPVELMTLLHGDDQYEWEELRKNAQYVGYGHTDEIIDNFWSVFTGFSEEQKKDFLTFLTGTDRLPRGRHSELQVTIKHLHTSDPDEHFPRAETCINSLQLPNYSGIDVLRQKLLHAITHCDVFGLS